jgi:EpsI family protein
MSANGGLEEKVRATDLKFKIVCMGLLGGIVFLYMKLLDSPKAGTASDKDFPSEIAGWMGRQVEYDEQVLGVLEADRIVYRIYERQNRESITLFVGYYDTLEGSDSSHSPVVCFTGQGWKIVESGKARISTSSPAGQTVSVNRMLLTKNGQYLLTLYWYQSGNRVFANRGLQKLFLFANALLGGDEENAFVRITLPFVDIALKDRNTGEISAFAEKAYAEIGRVTL